jgi:hypothetical protein
MTTLHPEPPPSEPNRPSINQGAKPYLTDDRRQRVRIAVLAVVVVGLTSTLGMYALQRLFSPKSETAVWDNSTLLTPPVRPQRVLPPEARAKLSKRWQHLQANETSTKPIKSSQHPKAPNNKEALSAHGAMPYAPPPPEDAYATLGGPVQEYQATAHRRPVIAQNHLLHRAAAIPSGRGTILHVRLVDEAASQPIGGPWVAHLEENVQVGPLKLVQGTELHGITVASTMSDHRLQMRAQFARLPDQSIQPVVGWVRDVQGRPGVRAHRVLNEQSAQNLGLTAVSRMAHQAGRLLAGQAGAVVGAGIEGATDSGAHKMETWAADDAVLLLKRGTRMQVYVESAGASGP